MDQQLELCQGEITCSQTLQQNANRTFRSKPGRPSGPTGLEIIYQYPIRL